MARTRLLMTIRLAACAVAAMVAAGCAAPPLSPADQALLTAARRGDVDEAKKALAAGANVNAQDSLSGDTALMRAAGFNHAAVARALLEAGAKPDVRRQNNTTALHDAAAEGHAEVVTLLVNARATVDARGGEGDQTPLARAVDNARADAVRELLEAGASIKTIVLADFVTMSLGNSRGAATVQIVSALMGAGADVEARNSSGETALGAAAHWCHLPFSREVAQALIAAGASLAAKDRDARTPAEHVRLKVQEHTGDYKARCEGLLAVLPAQP